jgi:Glycosyltransferase family 87
MNSRWLLPGLVVALAVVVWVVPMQLVDFYDQGGITDIPTYREAYDRISDGQVPYADFSLEYPPLAAGLFWLAGALPGQYEVGFSALMLLCLCATALGVLALARTLGLDQRRQLLASGAVAVSPLLLGNLVETRFDLTLAALLAWTLWAAAAGRFRLAWGLLAGSTLLKLVPLALMPVLLIWQRHRASARAAWGGLAACLAVVAVAVTPFAIAAPSGTWEIVEYHLDRPLQIESIGAAYLLGLHALADIPITVENSFGSQGLDGTGPAVIAGISTAVLVGLIGTIAWSLWIGLRRARPPGDARLFVAACAATIVALLVAGKVLSPQFLVWLLPVAFLVAGRYGPAAFAIAAGAMLLTLAYFPDRYWDLVALESGPIALLVLRDTALIALLAACWPRPSIAGQPLGRILRHPGADAQGAERAVAARYLVD